jgi:phosphopantetheinyl transferase (holo-ACP synthase)
MIGNDIVDFSMARLSRCKEQRFIDIVLNAHEQCLLAKSTCPFRSFWQMWAMKEAAYKAYVQLHPNRFFKPRSFECTGMGAHERVHYKNFSVEVITEIHESYAFAQTTSEQRITRTQIQELSANCSTLGQILRKPLFYEVSEMYGLSKSSLKIVKNKAGVPKVYCGAKALPLHISLTHHGRFAAYSIVEY